ncbi:MAG: KilA-N domain-containing protein [Deltaproteobacteria bacterium]|nr:KilA-N domain-containing protein [Deltaproteobacteria bacterium]
MFFKKKRNLKIQNQTVAIQDVGGQDYLSLTDMIKSKDGDFFVKDWLRNRNTLEFLGIWEQINNPHFNWSEFTRVKEQSGLNGFKISVKEWIEKTSAKGLTAQTGRYGGTYAHRDIAFEFGTWISPAFKLYLIKEYQRLKEIESNQYNLEWNIKRIVSKANYHIHTDAVKNHLITVSKKWSTDYEYAEEADILNLSIFGCTAKQWREANPERAKQGENIRDVASINELIVLSNMESKNAEMIRSGIDKKSRFEKLQAVAKHELGILNSKDMMKALKKTSTDVYLVETGQVQDKKNKKSSF